MSVDSTVFLGSRNFPSKNSTGFTQVLSSRGTTNIIMPNEQITPKENEAPKNPHEKGATTYARVYANDLANAEIFKDAPRFPVGAMIVREKLLSPDDASPELVTVMVKRERGFNPKNGDWEYLVVEGDLQKIKSREKKGDCAECHARAAQTDFVFKTYLK